MFACYKALRFLLSKYALFREPIFRGVKNFANSQIAQQMKAGTAWARHGKFSAFQLAIKVNLNARPIQRFPAQSLNKNGFCVRFFRQGGVVVAIFIVARLEGRSFIGVPCFRNNGTLINRDCPYAGRASSASVVGFE